ncbi:MAG: hypothetical protein QF685_11885 [Verrucomicrobiota bacterium]|nr:hypothetical protein [Verrucomicrobiota bacterium]
MKLQKAWMPLAVLCFGMNWSGVQLTVWTAMTVDNARKMSFKEAFKHALNGEKVIYSEEDSCICIPCRFVKWKHEEENQLPDELPVGQYSLEGVAGKIHRHLSPGYISSNLLSDLNHRLTPINSPPLSPPPRPFV